MKMFGPPNTAVVVKGNRPKGNKGSQGRQAMKGSRPPQKGRPKPGMAKKQKAEGNGQKNIARVMRYNYGKKGYYAQDFPEPQKTREQLKI